MDAQKGRPRLLSTVSNFEIERDLKNAIVMIVQAMSFDFTAQFKAAFSDESILKGFKLRLLDECTDLSLFDKDLMAGYRSLIRAPENVRFLPTVPLLIQYSRAAKSVRVVLEKQAQESKRMEADKLKKFVVCNPLQMLKDAKANSGKSLIPLCDLVKAHDDILAKNKRH